MSDFQLSLAAIGALAVVCVLVYNRLQERAARRDAESAFKSQHVDVLLDDSPQPGRREPAMATAAPAVSAAPAAPAPLERAREPQPSALPDAALDYVIELETPRPLAAAALLERWAPLERRFAPRARLAGSAGADAWQRVEAREPGGYARLRVALQLVNRSGVASEAELLEFRSQGEALAAALGATIASAPEMKQAMEAARALDAFCAEHDIEVALHVVAQGGATLQGTRIRAAAEAAGLHLEDDGRFALRDDHGALLYALGERSGAPLAAGSIKDAALHALTLRMDVPRTPDTQRNFESMARLARTLAGVLEARLVDDNDQALDERALAAIVAELNAMRRSMEARGIEPGGALALRLFA